MEVPAGVAESLATAALGWLINPLVERITVFRNLQANANSLSERTEALECLKQDLEGRVNECRLRDPYEIPSRQVEHWFQKVDSFLKQYSDFDASFSTRVPSGSIGHGYWSRYRLARRVVGLLREAENLTLEGRNFTDEQLVIPDCEKILAELEETVESLRRKRDTVRSQKEDLDSRVSNLVLRQRVACSFTVKDWFNNVERFLRSFTEFAESIARRDPFCSPPHRYPPPDSCSCSLIHELVITAEKLSEHVDTLIIDGLRFRDDQLIRVSDTMMEEIPIYSPVVGQDTEFSEALDLIKGDEDNVIGICGMGGLGKTILLKRINNYFCKNERAFDIIVWVTASKDMNVEQIQEQLIEKLGISSQFYGKSKSRVLHDRLDIPSFLLLMDDVWDRLELADIGIPPLSSTTSPTAKKRKVVMTTRLKQVCYDTGARDGSIVDMQLLNPHLSRDLFSSHVINKDLLEDPSVKTLAGYVIDECCGLPLALFTVAKTMARATEASEWRNAKLELEHSAYAFQGMNKVLYALKFSFDRLENDALRELLLYCSLYPEGHKIFKEDLAELLIAEGFFDSSYIPRDLVRNRAQGMISCLVDSGLLINHAEDTVKLHGCVRDMAVWLTDGKQDRSNLFLRWSPMQQSEELPRFLEWWQQAKRISMVCSNLEETPAGVIPDCSQLLTLLWEMGKLVNIHGQFFTCMPYLRVLNLSNCSVREVPRSIGHLTCLKYLNLQSTPIEKLPEEIGDLQQLMRLILRYTLSLCHIPSRSISRLSRLETLDMLESGYVWHWDARKGCHEISDRNMTLRDLEGLTRTRRLSDIAICIKCLPKSLEDYTNLISSITHLHLHVSVIDLDLQYKCLQLLSRRIRTLTVDTRHMLEIGVQFQSLHSLSLTAKELMLKAGSAASLFQTLSYLHLFHCRQVTDFTWAGQVPSLKVLEVGGCENLCMLLVSNETPHCSTFTPFPCLKELTITRCKSLRVISDEALLFPSLQILQIRYCEKLQKLPFNYQSANRLVKIQGLDRWWNALEWDDEDLKARFLPRFFPYL